jgi:uncharacterized membrane protein (DUF441 family)
MSDEHVTIVELRTKLENRTRWLAVTLGLCVAIVGGTIVRLLFGC